MKEKIPRASFPEPKKTPQGIDPELLDDETDLSENDKKLIQAYEKEREHLEEVCEDLT